MSITLFDPQLGELELRSAPFVVESFQIGSREPRVVTRNRALANGGIDDTRYSGARAITVSLVLNDRYDGCGDDVLMQDLYDRVMPYMRADRRPVLAWSLPGSPHLRRQVTVRGESAPIVITARKHNPLILSFRALDGTITSADPPLCVVLDPGVDVEQGRVYGYTEGVMIDETGAAFIDEAGDFFAYIAADRTYDRTYPQSLSVGDRQVVNTGNDASHWTLTIYGPVLNPTFKVNGITVTFAANGGVDLPAGATLVMDTLTRTVYLNGDPASPRYDRTNFTGWSWADLLLDPGANLVRFGGAVIGVGGQALLCTSPTWAG